MGVDVDIPTLRLQEQQVGKRRLAARQENQIRIAGQRFPRRNDDDGHVGFGGQRIEVVKIGDPGQPGDSDPDRAIRSRG